MSTKTPIHAAPIAAADVAFPHRFQLSEYECSWLEGPREDGQSTGGFVCVRISDTGDDSQDWIESEVQAQDTAQATQVARALIAEHEDAQQDA